MPLTLFKEKSPNQKTHRSTKEHRTKNRFQVAGNKIHFISLGCPRNLVDTEVMIGILLKAGYEATSELIQADYIVINTCGFLEASRNESLSVIGESFQSKKPGAKIVVAGCMVQKHKEQLDNAFPNIDYFLGSGDVEGILKAVQSTEQGETITSARSYLEAGEVPRILSTPKHYAYLKIAEGCRKQCAYCIIPKIKGPLKSKDTQQILKEFRALRSQGAKEIILIAQDLGDFGKDQGFKRSDGLLALLKEILKEEGDYWLRLLYLYPDEISDELIALMKSDKRICPYLDIPIQHINPEILKAMYRTTSKEEIIRTINALRREIPDITIRTSLIVGFPGETDLQFEELKQFLSDYRLDNVGIFKYSQEPDSVAGQRTDQISEDVKEKRHAELMAVQQKIVEENNARLLGKKLECIVEGYHPETRVLMVARHKGQCPDIDAQVIINDGRKVKAFGERYLVEITDVSGYDLVGRVL